MQRLRSNHLASEVISKDGLLNAMNKRRRKINRRPPIEFHVNTRDENGVKQPLDPKTAKAIGELLRVAYERYMNGCLTIQQINKLNIPL
jgi:hypothetical protein